jgi:hypothetical protein
VKAGTLSNYTPIGSNVLTRAKALVYSLEMVVEIVDGAWIIDAPWLDEPVTAPTWYEAYELALRARWRK